MVKNLFFTGNIGCGKSTAIAAVLGSRMAQAGGFLTVRQRDEAGRAAAFWLQRPDGTQKQCFLRHAGEASAVYPEVFDTWGVALLREARHCDFVVLDEIGGFELLSDPFLEALMELLQSDTPCIGVMKGEGPAGKMIEKLGMGETYIRRAAGLRQWMQSDTRTILRDFSRSDPQTLGLAEDWAAQYAKTSPK